MFHGCSRLNATAPFTTGTGEEPAVPPRLRSQPCGRERLSGHDAFDGALCLDRDNGVDPADPTERWCADERPTVKAGSR